VLPSGELHVRNVVTADAYKQYRCVTFNLLTNEEKTSDPSRLILVGNWDWELGYILKSIFDIEVSPF